MVLYSVIDAYLRFRAMGFDADFSQLVGFFNWISGYLLILMIFFAAGFLSDFLEKKLDIIQRAIFRIVFFLVCWIFIFHITQTSTDDPTLFVENLIFSVAGTFIIFLASILFRSFRMNRRRQRLEKEKIELELQNLRSKINPHFLFNSINTIYSASLKQNSNSKLSQMITDLAEIMRYQFEIDLSRPITIAAEKEYIEKFILFQQRRLVGYPVRIDSSFQLIDPDLTVYPMILINFIENAFKHGINLEQESFVKVMLKTEMESIILDVENCKFRENTRKSSRVGLSQTRQMLNLLYPGEHLLEITEDDQIYKIHLKLTSMR